MPVNRNLISADWVRGNALSLQDIVDELQYTGKINIFVLDTSRDNPFSNTRSLSIRQASETPSGTIMFFSTGRGQAAYDGEGDYGLFTEILLRNLKIPSLEIKEVFVKTIEETRIASDNKQIPELRINYHENFYLTGR